MSKVLLRLCSRPAQNKVDVFWVFFCLCLIYLDFSTPQDSATVIDIDDSMAKSEEDEGPRSQMEEKAFAANLHAFMKSRGSPIERIPHLGFKQSESLCCCYFTNLAFKKTLK